MSGTRTAPGTSERSTRSVVRTGREKGEHRFDTYNRTLSYRVEYRCACGHVGWTNHRDVLRYPIEE